MKKFKTKKPKYPKYLLIIIILFFLVFILLSFMKLEKSYKGFLFYLLNDSFQIENKKNTFSLMTKLDYFLDDYKFFEIKEDKEILPKKIVYLFNSQDKNDEIVSLLANNLKKLNIRSFIDDDYPKNMSDNYDLYLDIHYDNLDNSQIHLDKKDYAKIQLIGNYSIIKDMNDYLNSNYQGISRGITEKEMNNKSLIITVSKNNYQEVNNSTEIIALMIYDFLGDKNEKGN